MIKVENIDYWGFKHAIRGMRNPMNSWDKSDSLFMIDDDQSIDICGDMRLTSDYVRDYGFDIGDNDLDLMRRLYKGGSEHRKYLRQTFVSMDITAPLYWWKQMDQYKVGVTSNSCSTMHKIAEKEFTIDDFSREHLFDRQDIYHGFSDNDEPKFEDMPRMAGSAIDENGNRVWFTPYGFLRHTCDVLNHFRKLYLQETDPEEKKAYWWQMIQLLPSSYNQRRTVTMNYENVVTIIAQRSGHKLDEWNEFVDILKGLPYVKEIMAKSKEDVSREKFQLEFYEFLWNTINPNNMETYLAIFKAKEEKTDESY